MSIIEGIGPAASSAPANRGRRTGGARFALDGDAQPERRGVVETEAPVQAAGILALQEAQLKPPQDRAARRRGAAMLSALARLQHRLLSGTTTAGALDELADLIDGVPYATDPALAAALHSIVLRARVELARHGR